MRLTTLLLIFLLLILVGLANAQVTIKSEDLKSDTTEVRLLVSIDGLEFDKKSIYIIKAYEVMQVNADTVIWFYLDKNKKPLRKDINVWMSKPIKE